MKAARPGRESVTPGEGLAVLMLAPSSAVQGPVGKHTAHLVDGLRRLGCRVEVITWGRTESRQSVAARATSRLRHIGEVRRRLRSADFDVFVVKTAHDWATLVRDHLLLTACGPRRPPVVLQFHGSQSTRLATGGRSLFCLASRLLASRADAILVLSSDEQAAWSRICPSKPVHVVRNPYVARHPGGPRPRSGTPTVLFVGRVRREKGVFDLVDAARSLADLDVRLVVAGDGPDLDAVRDHASSTGVPLSASGYADAEQLTALYAQADVLALPTYWDEGFPTVISEAMDAGLPLVTTRARGMADHLESEVNALFVPPRDVRALSTALRRVLSDEGLRTTMGRHNVEKVREFSPDHVAAEYLRILTQNASA